MGSSAAFKKAISAIQEKGILLVYPLKNKAGVDSLWKQLHPRTPMRWAWDAEADQRVADLWILREEISRSGKVAYAKWYQNRATFFSLPVFTSLLAYLRPIRGFSSVTQNILEILEMDSPLSTKQLKEAAGMQGKWMESAYQKALKPLWQSLLIVGFGEIEDSSFPSLAVGATRSLFEECWQKSQGISVQEAEKHLNEVLGSENPFWLHAQKIRKSL